MTTMDLPEELLFPFQRLVVYRRAREFARLVMKARLADDELRDQATRAAKSTFLNLCEGLPDDRPRMRENYFRKADDSLHEAVGAIDLARAGEVLPHNEAVAILRLAVEVRAMLRGLRRPPHGGG
jgi:four helix bundle protein